VTVCPTGSLVEQDIADAATIPLPGFTQENSIGVTLESTGKHTKGPMTRMKRDEPKDLSGEDEPDEDPGDWL